MRRTSDVTTRPTAVRWAPSIREALVKHALSEAPREACGLLSGEREGDAIVVRAAVPAKNDLSIHLSILPLHAQGRGPERAYVIEPHAILAAQREARAAGLRLVGAYHSHPEGEATWSALDRALALDPEGRPWWPEAVHVVLAVQRLPADEAGPAVRAFTFDPTSGDFVPVPVLGSSDDTPA